MDEPRRILLGGDEGRTEFARANEKPKRIVFPKGMMIGEGDGIGEFDAELAQRPEEFFGASDTREGKPGPLGEAGGRGRPDDGVEDGDGSRSRTRGDAVPRMAPACEDQRVRARQRVVHPLSQRACRYEAPIAEPARGIDDENGEILFERGILQSVIHDDEARAAPDGGGGAFRPVRRDPYGRGAREEKRFVADIFRAVMSEIDADRPGFAPAIAAREKVNLLARRDEAFCDGERERRLARAARGDVADADNGNGGALRLRARAPDTPGKAEDRARGRKKPRRERR